MVNISDTNICIDQLTGLHNFFGFISADTMSMFDEFGIAIICDMEDFHITNRIYGHDFGDLCLKCFADVAVHELQQYNNTNIFRTRGDEFTIILPKLSLKDAEKVIVLIERNFKAAIRKYDPDININLLKVTLAYSNHITLINEFYHMLYAKLNSQNEEGFKQVSSDKNWPEQMICNFTQRMKETIVLSSKVYNLALSDDVSGLPNHRAASIYINSLISKNQKENKEFSILFIDGDNLRRYNKISYQSGNKMIKELSTIISNNMRKNDKIFRWLSGDEFIVVIDETNFNNALDLAERIRIAVEHETINWTYPITVSIGVSTFPNDGQNIDDIINKAEIANKHAKNTGKNKVIRWDFTMEA